MCHKVPMRQVTVREMRELLPEIESELRVEGELILTRRGKPVARVVPIGPPAARRPSNADLTAILPVQTVTSEELVREERDARG
jgi:antitoxin (DNA-binding transcriptional repressor) of toxin-antitoxin stability system